MTAPTTPDTEETVSLADLRQGERGTVSYEFEVISSADSDGDVKVLFQSRAGAFTDYLFASRLHTITRKPRPLAVGDRVVSSGNRSPGEILHIDGGLARVRHDDGMRLSSRLDSLTREAAQ